MSKYEKGSIIKGIVSGIEPYGVFIKVDEDYSGLVHISEISSKYVKNISDYVKLNELINVKVIDIDDKNCQLTLSIKDIPYKMRTNYKRKKIIETKLGFRTLAYKLPNWIDENIKNHKKEINSIDK